MINKIYARHEHISTSIAYAGISSTEIHSKEILHNFQ